MPTAKRIVVSSIVDASSRSVKRTMITAVQDRLEEELLEVEQTAIPGPGACGGMYTANTMASAIEALGMSLPYSSSTPATTCSSSCTG